MKKLFAAILVLCGIIAGIILISTPAQTMAFDATNATPYEKTGQRAFQPPAIRDTPLLINKDHPIPEGYEPDDLIRLYEQTRSFELATSDILLEREVFEAANRMFKQANLDGVDGFILTSGYRTREKQRQLYKQSAPGYAALPGTSEHECGLAFDVTAYSNGDFGTTEQFHWLKENCWDYGFILRYPEGKYEITGTRYEPWHYRYVGVETAQAMRGSGLTLEEYLGG